MIFKKTASLSGKQSLKNFEAVHHRRSQSSYLKIPRCTSGLCSFYAPRGQKHLSTKPPSFLTPSPTQYVYRLSMEASTVEYLNTE